MTLAHLPKIEFLEIMSPMNLVRILFFLLLCSKLFASDNVIYDDDNRFEANAHPDSRLREISDSVAAMVLPFRLVNDGDFFRLQTGTLKSRGICEAERFSGQTVLAGCTGFLISEDILVTAGHCITHKFDCQKFKWVFDFKITESNIIDRIPKKNVFSCEHIISREKNDEAMLDYAVIKLDRPVPGRRALPFRREGIISKDANLAVIGFPAGLPMKIAGGGIIRDNSFINFFRTNLDAFGGNSGSPVINTRTGVVEGILVRGEADFVKDEEQNCLMARHCSKDLCRGEDVTRMTSVAF